MLTQSRLFSEVRECLRLAIPLGAAQLAQSATTFVDTIMMGLLGSQTLAAGGLGAATFALLLLVPTGVVSAVSPLTAEAYGAGNAGRVGRVVRQGLWLTILLSIPLTLLVWNSGDLLRLTGQNPETVALTETYLKAIAWGYFPGLGFATLRSFVTALSKPRSVMVIVVLGTLLDIAASYVLMFGKFGFPALGLAGIGWGSVLSLWSMFIALIVYIIHQPELRQYGVFYNLQRFEAGVFWKLVKIGLPIGGMIGVEAGLFVATTYLMGRLGTIPLAAHQIALQSAALTFNIPLGISFATTVRVGQLLGQKNFRQIRLAGAVSIALGAVFMGAMALLFWSAPGWVVSLYLDVQNPANAEVVVYAKSLLAIAAIFQIVDGIQVVAAGALRGLQDTRIPMLIAVMAYWCVGFVSGHLLGVTLGLGGVGLWWGLAFGLTIAAVVLSWRFFRYSQGMLRSLRAAAAT